MARSLRPGAFALAASVVVASGALSEVLLGQTMGQMTIEASDPIQVEVEPDLAAKPYRSLTNSKRSVTNFNVEVVRGAVTTADDVFGLNAYASTIVRHGSVFTPPEDIWRTVNNPVSIAVYDGDLFVVGQGNYTLARHDAQTGEIKELLMLRPGAADLVIDEERAEAWVSCMDDDSVMQIALTTPLSVTKVWSWDDGLELKRPRFLSLETGSETDPTDNRVFVAPLVSGNNTLTSEAMSGVIVDGFDPLFAPEGALPDNDLFVIQPSSAQPVRAVLKGVASLLYGHGRNPFER